MKEKEDMTVRQRILEYLVSHSPATDHDIARGILKPEASVRRDRNELERNGVISYAQPKLNVDTGRYADSWRLSL